MTRLQTARTTTGSRSIAESRPRSSCKRTVAWLALWLGALCAPLLRAQQPTFLPVIIADFNHDGIPDVLVPAASGLTATVSLGTVPYGTFSPNAKGVTFPACSSPGTILTGDFNGDGFPDIFFNCPTAQGPYANGVMLGNGDGTFGTSVNMSATNVYGAVLGDFNHDGKLDVALIEFVPGSTQVERIAFQAGNGDGTFAKPVYSVIGIAQSTNNPYALVQNTIVADVDGDGYPDLITATIVSSSGPTSINVFGNNKDGTFGTASSGSVLPNASVSLGAFPAVNAFQVLAANVFGSGKPDFVVRDGGTNAGLFILQNTSTTGAFSLVNAAKIPFAGIADFKPGNFTGSTFSDLAVSNGTTLSILANDGSGNFSAAYSALTLGAASPFAVADANGDGYADIYTASMQSGALQLAVNLVSGSATATSQPFSLGIGSKAVSATWGGNVDFAGSTATGMQIVNGVPTTATVSSSKNPSLVGDTIILTATVAPATSVTRIPSGMVILMDGTTRLASGTLDGTGAFAYTTSALTQGTHVITAVYAGDTYFAAATSLALSQVVNHAAPVAPTLNWATPAAISFGTPLSATQLNATATNATGGTIPGTFVYTPAAGTVLSAGVQTLSVTFTPTDLATYTVLSKTVMLTVLPGAATTTLAVTAGGAAASTVGSGSVVTLTASVVSAGAPVTAGQINFCDAAASFCTDIHLLGTAQLTSAGTAVASFVPGIGVHSYKAVFLGTKNNTPSTSAPVSLTVTGKYATTTAIAQSGTVGNYTLTATTVGAGAAALSPTGPVSFLDTSNANAVLAAAPLGTGKSAMSFLQASNSALGVQSTSVTKGDFNGDGKLDLATTNYYANTVTILLGNGDGTFSTGPTLSSGPGPQFVIAADFNGDGKPDLAVANYGGRSVTVFLGNGDGTFTTASTSPAGSEPHSIAVGDFNGDGRLDLVTVNLGDDTATVLLGQGDGTFVVAPALATGSQPYSVASGDFNGDGKPDIVVANSHGNTLTVFLGVGDGTFTTAAVSPTTGLTPVSVVTGDFNGDGKADLAVANFTDNNVTVLLGNGDGSFRSAASPATGTNPIWLTFGDFNGDGKADLSVANLAGNTVTVLAGAGDGTFTQAALLTVGAAGALADVVVAGDLNGDGIDDLTVASVNNSATTLTALLTQLTQTATATATGVAPLGGGTHQVVASYGGDSNFAASLSTATSLTGLQTTPTLTWTPAVATIVYGTPLGPQQLNAVATGMNGVALAGTFTYTPPAGTVLSAGMQTLSVLFTPSDPRFLSVTGKATITVTQAAPVLTWATPASIAYGIPLGGVQLNATVTGVTGAALPGTLTYTPPAGTVLTPGTQTLMVSFAPTDAVDYTSVAGSVKLVVTGVSLASFTPNTATLGDPNKTITLTGSGFVANSVVQVNGTAIATTLVNPTTLTAVVPAANFLAVGTLQVAVLDPAISQTTAALPLTVVATQPAVTLTGPSTTAPGTQPSVSLTINNPYPVALTAIFRLQFAAAVTPAVTDPAIQFVNGGTTYTVVVPANSTVVPPIQFAAGTIAGTITIPVTLTAGGTNVTPATLQPLVVVIPAAVPNIANPTLTRSGDQIIVTVSGFSNTREMAQATFHFSPALGTTFNMPDVTVPAATLFGTWYSSAASAQYGSTFLYSQSFTVSSGAGTIGAVQVTLTNTVGASVSLTTQ